MGEGEGEGAPLARGLASRGLTWELVHHELERREGEVDLVGMVLIDKGDP